MQKINTIDELKACIQELKYQQTKEWNELKEETFVAYENLTPFNILKTTLQKTAALPNLKNTLIDAAFGLTAGYLSKTLLIGASKNPIKNFIGALMQFEVANVVSQNTNIIKFIGKRALTWMQNKSHHINTSIIDSRK